MNRKSWVCADGEWYEVKNVFFIDIEEGLRGDEMSFKVKGSDKVYKSIIALGSKPG